MIDGNKLHRDTSMKNSKGKTACILGVLGMALPLALAGCGGDSGTDGGNGSLTVGVTDAPIDSANKVVMQFTGVEIKPAEGEWMTFEFDTPKNIDLLTLQGSQSIELLSDQTVQAGEYESIRLMVNAEFDGTLDSFIKKSDGSQLELRIPSGSQSGLKLVSGFTVPTGGSSDFTIDFDVRKSIVNPQGQQEGMFLKPTLRMVDNVEAGTLSGTVSGTLISEQCAGDELGAVYVYSGADMTPMDIQGADSDPIATALVNFAEEMYQYEVGFLATGDYTVAYTCDAVNDDVTTPDTLTFMDTQNAEIMANATTTVNFDTEMAPASR